MSQPQAGQPGFDPFEQGGGAPAVSFKAAPPGSFVTIAIDEDAKWLQTRDFETGEPEFWDARPGEQPNPKMAAVVTGVVQSTPWADASGQTGERKALWAGYPSNLFEAVKNAKKAAGNGTALPILAGGTLHVAFTGEEPNKKNPRLNNVKLYAAQYVPPPAGYAKPDAFEGNQPFTGGQQAQQQPQQGQFGQQAPAQQQFAQPAPQQPQQGQFGGGQPQGQPFGGQQQGFPAQQPQGQQFAQQGAPQQFQPPVQPQVPAQAQQPQFQPPAQQQVPQGFAQGAPAGQPGQQGQGQQFGQQAPQQAATDPWSSAPVADASVPNF